MKSVLRKAGRFFAADKKRLNFFWLNCLKQPVRIDERPSSVNEVDSFPPWGSLDVRQGFTFLPKKMKFAEFFFQTRGSRETRQEFYRFAYTCRKETEVFFGDNADIEKMRKKIIKIRKIAQKQFTKEKNTNII